MTRSNRFVAFITASFLAISLAACGTSAGNYIAERVVDAERFTGEALAISLMTYCELPLEQREATYINLLAELGKANWTGTAPLPFDCDGDGQPDVEPAS